MKLKAFALFLLFAVIFSVTAFADTPKDVNMSLNFDDGYFVITEDTVSKNQEIIENLGYTKSSFKELFTKGSLVAFVLHSGTKTQIQIRVDKTSFTEKLEDLSLLNSENLTTVAKEISPSCKKTVDISGTVFLQSVSETNDETGKYSVSQYVTVKNGSLYTFSFYSTAPNESFENETLILSPIKTLKKKAGLAETVLLVIMSVVIVAFVAAAGFLAVSIFSQIKRGREDNDVREFVKIKRRRF